MSAKAYLALISTFFAIFSLTSANLDASHGVSHFSRHKRLGRQLQSAANTTLGDATVVPVTTASPVPEALEQPIPLNETAVPTAVSAPAPVQPVDSGTSSEISTMRTRRVQSIIDSLNDGANVISKSVKPLLELVAPIRCRSLSILSMQRPLCVPRTHINDIPLSRHPDQTHIQMSEAL